MNNAISPDFEKQKNIKAFTVTSGIAGALLIIFIFVRWSLPPKEVPPEQQFVEIELPDEPPFDDPNLGNNDVGSGKVQPIVTGTPSSAPVSQQAATTHSNSSQVATKDVEPDNDPKSPSVPKATAPNNNKEINNNTDDQAVKAKPVPQPKAVFKGGTGNGTGGNTDLPGFNKPGGQGPGDGVGDKGVRNGNPNGTKYFGVKEFSIPNQAFEDDFNQNAKIAMEIVTDNSGKVISATYTSKGSTGTATNSMIEIARRRAFQLKLGSEAMKGTVIFNFKVKG
jgi:hypothetical protein